MRILYTLLILILTGCLDTPAKPEYTNPWDADNPNRPSAPMNACATVRGIDIIELHWEARANNQDGYSVYESINDLEYALIELVDREVIHILMHGKCQRGKYAYKVVAYNLYGESDYSNITAVYLDTVMVFDTTYYDSVTMDTVWVSDTLWYNDTTYFDSTVFDTSWFDSTILDTSYFDSTVYDTTVVIDTLRIIQAPTDLQIELSADSTEILLSWLSEEVDYFECWNNIMFIDTCNENTMLIQNIIRGTTYRFKIRSVKENVISDFSEIIILILPGDNNIIYQCDFENGFGEGAEWRFHGEDVEDPSIESWCGRNSESALCIRAPENFGEHNNSYSHILCFWNFCEDVSITFYTKYTVGQNATRSFQNLDIFFKRGTIFEFPWYEEAAGHHACSLGPYVIDNRGEEWYKIEIQSIASEGIYRLFINDGEERQPHRIQNTLGFNSLIFSTSWNEREACNSFFCIDDITIRRLH